MSKCTRCGHECHCGTDCEECVNDVCHDCNCYEVSEDGCQRMSKLWSRITL